LTFPDNCYKLIDQVTPDVTSVVWNPVSPAPAITSESTTLTTVSDPGPVSCPPGAVCEGQQITLDGQACFAAGVSGTFAYNYTVTDEYSCQYSGTINVDVTCPCPTAAISYAGTPFCASIATEQPVTLTGTDSYLGGLFSASPAGLSINTTTGAVLPSASVPGTYTVTYTIPALGACPETPVTTSVTVIPLPTITGTLNVCINSTTQLTGSGTPAASNAWLSSNTAVATVSGTGLVTGVSQGTSTITYTDNNGCQQTAIVTVNPLPTISGTLEVCVGLTTQLTGSGTPAASNAWLSSNTSVATVSGTGLVTGVSQGTSTITYTDNNGCQRTATVTVNAPATANISYAGSPFCASVTTAQPVTLTGTGSFSGGSYSSTVGLTINATTGAITPSTSVPGTYTVTYTIPASGSCPATPVTTSVTITAVPTANISYAGSPYCSSLTTAQAVTLSGTGSFSGGSYSSTVGLTIDGTTGAITPSTSVPGTYTVTYRIPESGGCPEIPVTTTVTITQQPTATISYASPICVSQTTNQAVVLTGTGSFLGGSYSADPVGLTINASTGAITPSTSTVGTYTVTYTIPQVGGCPPQPVTTSVTIDPVPSFTLVGNDPSECNFSDGSIVISGLDANTDYEITYNDDAVPVGPLSFTSDGSGQIIISGLNAGSYDNIRVSFTTTGCGATNVAGVNLQNPGAPIIDDPADVVLCDEEYILPEITGVDITPDAAYFSGPNATGTRYEEGDVIASSITLFVFDANGACTDQKNFTITINTEPTATISYAGPFCENTVGTFGVTLNGTGAFADGEYSAAPAGLTINASTGAITPSTSAVGDYTVTYVIPATGGCPEVPVTTTVTITELPTAGISYSGPYCNSQGVQSVTLTGTGDYETGSYSSSAGLSIDALTGEIDPSNSVPDTYTVTYTIAAAGGCDEVTAQATVTITSGPTASISYAGPYCDNETAQSVTLAGTGAYLGGEFSADPAGLTINTADGTINPSTSTPGTYTVTYMIPEGGGCPEVPVTTTVTITELPTAGISYSGPYCNSQGVQSVTLTGTGDYETGSYSSSAGLSIDALTGEIDPSNSVPDTYTVTYTIAAAGGCDEVTAQATVTITEGPTASISYAGPYCDNETAQSVTLTGTGAYLGGEFSADPAGLTINTADGTINPSTSTPGTYTVTYMIPEGGGCPEVPVTTTVTINATPVFNLSGTDPTVCNASDGEVVISGLELNAAYSVQYTQNTAIQGPFVLTSDGFGEIVITGLPAGNYADFTLTLNGCTGVSSGNVLLNNPGAPVVNPIASVTSCDEYELQPIAGSNLSGNEAYYTQSGGLGDRYEAGEILTGTITLYAYDNQGTCFNEQQFTVTINITPSIDNPGNQEACDEYTLPQITGSNLSSGASYYDNSQALSGLPLSGIITSTQTVWIYDANGSCSDELSFEVEINNSPTLAGMSEGGVYCEGETVSAIEVELTGVADFVLEYSVDGVVTTVQSSTATVNLGVEAGEYVLLSVTDANCASAISAVAEIVINPVPDSPVLSGDTLYCFIGIANELSAETSLGGTLRWYSDALLTQEVAEGEVHTPLAQVGVQEFYVTETLNGCVSEASVIEVEIERCETILLMPDAFTPNGDGVNDVFEITNKADFREIEMRVYNRWGEVVHDGRGQDHGWDGTYNGRKAKLLICMYTM
jgi:gliding motility-associated-like protein